MKILKGILLESKEYYLGAKKNLEQRIADIPSGSVKERIISGKKYYYLQQRVKNKVVHKYLGKSKPDSLMEKIRKRKALKSELKKVNEALIILRRAQGRRHD